MCLKVISKNKWVEIYRPAGPRYRGPSLFKHSEPSVSHVIIFVPGMPALFHRADYASVVVWYVIGCNQLTCTKQCSSKNACAVVGDIYYIYTFSILKYNFLLYFMESFYDLILPRHYIRAYNFNMHYAN